ncbi:DnaA N-terminal domain-containing protein [Oceanicella sp. SM1341]|uniref:DnaA N-terminal domain-containing protein n=1 Tax=Oceanicella sp. SM1341 TaxID=1548889 RepID=UPI000E4A1F11|nr:DnaA N-terminal domain-containing protein [Oceanicella sp. SM1341]
MTTNRLTGSTAPVRKYDLLTALAVLGLSGAPARRTTTLRLIAMITARYNWQADEISIGCRDLARLWSVDERTAKRELKRLREAGLIDVKRPAARGRVAVYRLDHTGIERVTAEGWHKVGTDYVERMEASRGGAAPEAAPAPKVVPLFPAEGEAPAEEGQDPFWAGICRRLRQEDPGLFRSWFAGLRFEAMEAGELRLGAPSAFVAGYVDIHLRDRLERVASDAAEEAVRLRIGVNSAGRDS